MSEHPQFIQALRRDLESQIDKMKKELDELLERAGQIEDGISERREAIQRLIGVATIESAKKHKAPPVAETTVRDVLYTFKNRESFTIMDLADELEVSRSAAYSHLKKFIKQGTIKQIAPGGPRKPAKYKFIKVS